MLKIPKIEYSQQKTVLIGLALLIIVSLSVSGFYVYRYNSMKNDQTIGKQDSEKEIKELVTKVGKIYELPSGETPQVIIVTDPSKLKSQPFFANARIGDKVLVYVNARKGILYRPSTNQIINVSPINFNQQDVSQNPSKNLSDSSKTVRISLFNGTQKSGLANQFEQMLKQKITNVKFDIVEKSNAKKSNYKLTQVIDLKGNLNEDVVSIARALEAENAKLPTGETVPNENTDILIIIGSDYVSTTPSTTVPPTASE